MGITMQSIKKLLRVRSGLVACACVGLLAGGAGAASAAPGVASHSPQAVATATPSPSPTAKATITAHAHPTSVKSGGTVIITGSAPGLKAGDTLTVQRMNSNGTFSNLDHVTTTVKSNHTYSVHTTMTTKGTEKLRVIHGSTHSTPVTVTVT
jgi:hypothetical protein